MGAWSIERHGGAARSFHARVPDDVTDRAVWIFDVDSPALALGSTQPADDVDVDVADRLGIDVFARHSGGGAVLMLPGSSVWIDVVIPADDRLWTPDVSAAALWLGDLWASVLAEVGVADAMVHRGPMVRPAVSSVMCFGGLAPGEVWRGGKTVGISQRRTRRWARFQTIALLDWDAEVHRALLAPGLERVTTADDPATGFDDVSISPLRQVAVDALVEAFVAGIGQIR